MATYDERISSAQTPKKPVKNLVDKEDPTRFIFPSGQAAPGAAISPAPGTLAPTNEELALPISGQVAAAQLPISAAGEEFVNPSDPSRPANVDQSASAAQAPVENTPIPDTVAEYDKAMVDHQKSLDPIQSEQEAVAKQQQAVYDQILEGEKTVEKVKPTDIFAGKSTWQKILGGVGMFIGSLTPEGARNIANMIDKEIDRDQNLQLTNIKLKQDKENKHFQTLLQKFGSQDAALKAKKLDAFTMLDLHLKKLEVAARNVETRARITQGREELALKKQALQVDLMKASMTAQKDAQKGSIQGYSGVNQNPTIVKDMTERVTAKNNAMATISKLENLLKEGSVNPFGANNELAQQNREKLAADLAKAMFGRSSDTELEVARKLIPDITSIRQRGSIDQSLFKNLRNTLATEVDNAASAAGYRRTLVQGARKM